VSSFRRAASRQAMYGSRPQEVLNAIQEKLRHTKDFKWEKDCSANYTFGAFGSGLEALEAAVSRARQRGAPELSVLDVGAGSGGFLQQARAVAAEGRVRLYARGLTGGSEEPAAGVQAVQGQWLEAEVAPTSPPAADGEADVALLHAFPAELLHQSACDFVREGRAFDLVVASWTLRHLCEPLGTLEFLSERLAPGGVLLGNELFAPVGDGGLEPFREAARDAAGPSYSVELDVQGEALRFEGDDLAGGYEMALRITRGPLGEPGPGAGVRFPVALTGEVSGPMGGPHSGLVSGIRHRILHRCKREEDISRELTFHAHRLRERGAVLKSTGQYLMAQYSRERQ